MSVSDEINKMVGRVIHPEPVGFPKLSLHNPAMEDLWKSGKERVAREEIIAHAAAQSLNAASDCIRTLRAQIEDFEQCLNNTEEVALCIIGGPSGMSFFPTSIFAIDPDKVVFKGIDQNDRSFVVVQHVSQLNFALQAAQVAKDEAPRRIGFHHPEDD